jgi:hypothetical protein
MDGSVRQDGAYLIGDGCLLSDRTYNMNAHCYPVLPSGEYRVAVNDYIAAGGSGFAVLKRNTTKFNTGISLRDALTDYIAESNNRCDASQYVNVLGVSCTDGTGTNYDCSATCACLDKNMSVTTDTSCAQFKTCSTQSLKPQVRDYRNLPCLDNTMQPHDGRLFMVQGN